ncbi:hypothetical protein FXW78_50585 [Rhodococcus opacus]|nr:hypothetical protein [Rhodococcus opacus]RZL80868.1 MAG: hypothetical protein EOP32_15985 [Rhodococcus sp. (in: high G+C Gram-positive bacteria)]
MLRQRHARRYPWQDTEGMHARPIRDLNGYLQEDPQARCSTNQPLAPWTTTGWVTLFP